MKQALIVTAAVLAMLAGNAVLARGGGQSGMMAGQARGDTVQLRSQARDMAQDRVQLQDQTRLQDRTRVQDPALAQDQLRDRDRDRDRIHQP